MFWYLTLFDLLCEYILNFQHRNPMKFHEMHWQADPAEVFMHVQACIICWRYAASCSGSLHYVTGYAGARVLPSFCSLAPLLNCAFCSLAPMPQSWIFFILLNHNLV